MHLIVYSSDFNCSDFDVEKELEQIEAKAKKNNKKENITGVLFYHNNKFFQVLEGDKPVLDKMMRKLDTDPRHSKVSRLVDEAISTRSFSDWNMDSFNLTKYESLDEKELRRIAVVYREVLMMKSDALVNFYKNALESHALG